MEDNDRGAAAVEFALVLPLLLLLLFGIIDFGRAYHSKVTLTHAAREGARALALAPDAAAGTDDLNDRLASGALAPGAIGTVTVESLTACGTGNAAVVLKEQFDFLTPLPGLAIFYGGSPWATSVTLRGRAVMRCRG